MTVLEKGTTASTAAGRTAGRTRGRRRRLRRLTRKDHVVLTFMVGIPLLVELLLVWLPAVGSVFLSFAKWDGIGSLSTIHSVGLRNYDYVLHSYPSFWPAVRHNLIWLGFLALLATPLGIFIAVLLDGKIRGSRIYQTIFFIPVMLSLALIGIIWELVYSQNNGLLNNVLGTANTSHAVDWYGDSNVNIWAALVAASWRHVGYIMILYLAGLKGVDPALKEAAELDGATPRQSFFHVVLPAMRPINIVVIVITIIESLRAFDIVYVINGGTNGLELLSALVVQLLKGEGLDLGDGSAIAVILLLISLIPITIYLNRTFRKDRR